TFELASGNCSKPIRAITLEDNPTQLFRCRDICVHINGAIQNLHSDSLEKSFKLSESSYTNSDAFSDSSWSYRFKKDIEMCTQILFIGYSLYDMEVKRLLVNNEQIKNKTFFITRTDISTKEHHRLSKFGEVFPIGNELFSKNLVENKPKSLPMGINYLSALKQQKLEYESEYSDSDVRDFLLRGISNINKITSSLTSSGAPFAIKRTQIDEVLNLLKEHNVVVIHGSLANGKSVILQQIQAMLLLESKKVFTIKDIEANYEEDIEKLGETKEDIYLIIDDFEQSLDLIRYFCLYLKEHGKLILSERPHKYRRAISILESYEIQSYHIGVDYLMENEIIDLEKQISLAGLWGEYAGRSHKSKIEKLKKSCESQLSLILMDILKSKDVAERFERDFQNILKHPDTKKTLHSICLIQHISPSQCTKSFISDISNSNHVYSSEFENRINESNIFEYNNNILTTKSAIFSTFILNSLYKSSYSIDQLVLILEKLQRNWSLLMEEQKNIYSSMMKFSTISSILPDSDKPSCYIEFYEKLKRSVSGVTTSPHYWLQYGMAIMSTNNLEDAERILTEAEERAKTKNWEDMEYIENQFARLYLKKAIREKDPSICISLFEKADNLLKHHRDDIHKFRQAGLYITFYNEKYPSIISGGQRAKFEKSMKNITKKYEEFLAWEYPSGDIPPYHEDNINEFKTVILDFSKKKKTKPEK
ncbi:hypothetical protein FZI59_23805, partial [Vibrio parahaemolyticus]|nr:hypothetical protein [Vibrio parahaemolyticus]